MTKEIVGGPRPRNYDVRNDASAVNRFNRTERRRAADREGVKASTPRQAPIIVRDERTGSQFLQIPMPKPEVLREVTDALQKLLAAFKG